MRKSLLLILIPLIFLAGCYDRVELENRAFVISLGIDKAREGSLYVSQAIPDVGALANRNGQDNQKALKTAEAGSLPAALQKISADSGKKMDYGHTKLCVFSEGVLKDEKMFRESLDALERNRELSREMTVLAADKKAEEILNAKPEGEAVVGLTEMADHRSKSDLQGLISELRESGTGLVPKITIEGDEIRLGGFALIKDFCFAGWISAEDARGQMWIAGNSEGAQLETKYEDIEVPLRITKAERKKTFGFEDGKLIYFCKIDLETGVESYTFSEENIYDEEVLKSLEQSAKESIEAELRKTWDIYRDKFKADVFSVREELYKNNHELYRQLENNWEETFMNMELRTEITVRVSDAGAVK